MQRRIVILVADGVVDSGLSIALDVFRTANAIAQRAGKAPPFHVDVASARGGPVTAASGMVLKATATPRMAARADVVLVPGLWVEDASGVDKVLERDDVRRLVRTVQAAHARGALVGSSCGGAFVLGDAGVLDGRVCTTTWWLAPHLKERIPAAKVEAERSLVVGDSVLTAGAVFAQADLSLHLVGRFAGPSTSRLCARLLLLDVHPSQSPYMAIHQLAANDPTVRRAEAWVRGHLEEEFDIGTLGRTLGVSPRTLSRRLTAAVGLSPIAFVQRLRVERALHLIETTNLSMREIGTRVGYQDPNALRRLVQREAHASPRELRMRVRGERASATIP